MKKQNYYSNKIPGASLTLVFTAFLLQAAPVVAQTPDSVTLRVPFKKGQVFDVPRSEMKVKIDLEDFETTYDSQPEEMVLVVAGNSEHHFVVKITADTLYTDLEKKPSEYRDLWWYFYTQDTTLDIGKLKVWEEDGRDWSTHTIMTSNNVEVNERHYDLFEIQGNHSFHVSIKRPLYLEGDSTLMLAILNSFEVIAPDSTEKGTD